LHHRVKSARVEVSGAKPGLSHKRKNTRLGIVGNGFVRRVLVLKRAGNNTETEGSGSLIRSLVSPDVIRAVAEACGMRWRECIQ